MAEMTGIENMTPQSPLSIENIDAEHELHNYSLEQLLYMIAMDKEEFVTQRMKNELKDLHDLNSKAAWLLDLKAKIGSARTDKGELSLKNHADITALLKEAKDKYGLEYNESAVNYKRDQAEQLIENINTLLKKINDKQSIIMTLNLPELMNFKTEFMLNSKKGESTFSDAIKSCARACAGR